MRSWLGWAASLLGAGLLAVPARVYRIDVLAESCARWPPATTNLTMGAIYLAALTLLTVGWLITSTTVLRRRTALVGAVLVHVVALVLSPPFLSMDPLFYVGIGHVAAVHGNPYHSLATSLPANDQLLLLLPESWRMGTSAYFPGFNQLARLVTLVAGGAISVELRLFQAIASLCMLIAAAVVSSAVRRQNPGDKGEPIAARALSLVALCPLTIVEGTVTGHNDALVAVSVAVSLWLVVRGRRWAALGAASLGLLFKASSILVVIVEGGALVLRRLSPPMVLFLTTLFVAVAGGGLWWATLRWPAMQTFTALIGTIDNLPPHCTHSWESLPRAFAYAILHSPVAVFAIGLVFRVAGLLWLAWSAARAARDPDAVLGWLATAVFVYYLCFHGYMESWYLLVLVPLAPFAPARFAVALRVYLVAQVAWYPVVMWRMCDHSIWGWAAKEVTEGLIVTVIPTVVLLYTRYAASRPASAGRSDMR